MHSLNNEKIYRKFIKARDENLEVILHNTTLKIDNILRNLFSNWINTCMIPITRSRPTQGHDDDFQMIKNTQTHMEIYLSKATEEIWREVARMRRKIYILTVASEAEAIGRALNKKTQYTISDLTLKRIINSDGPSGGEFKRRIQYQLNNVMDKLKKTAHWVLMNKDVSEKDALKMLSMKLPKTKDLERKKRVLKPLLMTEADQKPKTPDFSSGPIADEDWEEIMDDYRQEIFVNRSPEEVFEIEGPRGGKTGIPHYAWEMEKEVTQDFVNQVRLGQVDAAKQNGIIEFVWIAVVDDRTDDCCLWRDGLTTTEIEQRLKTSEKDDECQTSVPPAHFNCRCQLAPATVGLPDAPASNETEFEEWLNN